MKKIFGVFVLLIFLSGCALATRYVSYTGETFPHKPKYYFITVYPLDARPAASETYTVIGRVEVEGYLSSGASQDSLLDEAKVIARQKGADGIINAKYGAVDYQNVDVTPGYRGYHYYQRPRYYVYSDRLMTFKGDLIVFVSKR